LIFYKKNCKLIESLKPVLTADLLQQAITYLVAEANLLYAIVEHQSFKHLLEVLNPATLKMDFGRKTILRKVDMLFIAHKRDLQNKLEGIKYLSYTVDAWTSSNAKAFMAITAHGITLDWKMIDVLVAMPPVSGEFFFFVIFPFIIFQFANLIIPLRQVVTPVLILAKFLLILWMRWNSPMLYTVSRPMRHQVTLL
jgi:hypothetical protein